MSARIAGGVCFGMAILIVHTAGAVGVTNCIVWGHAVADATNFPAGSIGYSLLAIPNLHGVNNCITNAPVLMGANDYRLREKPPSPGIDVGLSGLTGWMLGDTDLAGARRLQGAAIDMGAYESSPPRGSRIIIQ